MTEFLIGMAVAFWLFGMCSAFCWALVSYLLGGKPEDWWILFVWPAVWPVFIPVVVRWIKKGRGN